MKSLNVVLVAIANVIALRRECELDEGELRIVLYSDGAMKKVIAN